MNAYPPIGPLEPRLVKELVRQIRVLRFDYPALNDEELAAEWAEGQRWRMAEQKPTPFADWLATSDWEAGFRRALALAIRLSERSAQQRALRQKAKAWKREHAKPKPRVPTRPERGM